MRPGYCHQCDAVRQVIATYKFDIEIYTLGIDFSYEQFIVKFGHGHGLPLFIINGEKTGAIPGLTFLMKSIYDNGDVGLNK